MQTTFLWVTFSGGRQLTAGLWGPLGSAVPGDSGPPAARRVRANTTSVFRFQSGKLVTKMFQKIQDLIDDKDALVFVLIDEVGVCGRRTRACGGSSPDRPLPLLGHGPPPAQPTVSHGPVSGIPHTERARVAAHTHPCVCSRAPSACPAPRGQALPFPLCVPTGGEPHGRPQRLQGGHRAFRRHPRGQCRPDPNRSNQKVIVPPRAVGAGSGEGVITWLYRVSVTLEGTAHRPAGPPASQHGLS